MTTKPSAMRAFDPLKASKAEVLCVAYFHKRRWLSMPRPLFDLAAQGYGLFKPVAAHGAFLLLQAWRAYAVSPDRAASAQAGFYALVKRASAEGFDPARVARLEMQARARPRDEDAHAEWLMALYQCPRERVAQAAFYRAEAGRYLQQWLEEGCKEASSLLRQYEADLFKSYAALRAAVLD